MPIFGGGGGVAAGSNVQMNSLGVGIAPDNVAGDGKFNGTIATGGNASPSTAGDVYIGRTGGVAAGVLLMGNSAASPNGQIEGNIDSGSNSCINFKPGAGPAVTVGNVYFRLRSGLTFSNLPAAASFEGALASITDSNTAVWGATAAGGGTNHVVVYSDGTNWTVVGK